MTKTQRAAVRRLAAARRGLGAYGEDLALRHLRRQGLVLLDRNWRCDEGELDLVLREGDVLVVCEVKTRSSVDYGTPHEGVDAVKLERLGRLAEAWQRAHGVTAPEVRIDLVGIVRPRRGAATIEHVRGLV
jgi:putative endonuclease